MGMSVANEKMFNIADKMLNTTDKAKYFLYGGTKRRNIFRNSFIFVVSQPHIRHRTITNCDASPLQR